jgi:hypothetical protein
LELALVRVKVIEKSAVLSAALVIVDREAVRPPT